MSLLTVNNLGKAFRTYKSEWHRFANWFGFKIKPAEEHWVLRHIDFEIHAGEAIGIIGQNGAGKSTLLKMITGTLQATEGSIQINGRIAAILELGMGFNPELTGRKNVFHAAGLMGFNHEQISEAMSDIEAFAEIGDYFDQPVRVYSSGMQVRVAFSVATAFQPEILIVDEALSVGDAYFQSKSFAKMVEMKNLGVTIILVSHDIQAMRTFCDRSFLIDDGVIKAEGRPAEIVPEYEKLLFGYRNELIQNRTVCDETIEQENTDAVFLGCRIVDKNGIERSTITCDELVFVEFGYRMKKAFSEPHYGIKISDRFGNSAFETNTYCMKLKNRPVKVDETINVRFKFNMNLGGGDYMIDVAIVDSGISRRDFQTYISINRSVSEFKLIENTEHITYAGYYNMKPDFTRVS